MKNRAQPPKEKTAIKLAKWVKHLFAPKRYKVTYGGRGSGKSYAFAIALLILGSQKCLRILCAREFQNSIKDSSHKLLCDQIEKVGLQNHYTSDANGIYGKNGTEFIFKGVKMNTQSIKSMEGIDILWLEEAQTISESSWTILVPTIRKTGSEIWATFNPLNDDDPTYTRFVNDEGEPQSWDGLWCMKVNWRDNPWFPDELKAEMAKDLRNDPDKAAHVWEGECLVNSDAQIMKNKWVVQDFEVPNMSKEECTWNGPYFGADWGFSNDPATLLRMYLDTDHNGEMTLYIRNEFYKAKVDMDFLPDKWAEVPESKTRVVRADNSRPETISHMSRHGYNVIGAMKWSGSVEDGITWLRSLKRIVIHPDCPCTAKEALKYSYKTDRLTGDITRDIVDKHNHSWDAVRYGMAPFIEASKQGILSAL